MNIEKKGRNLIASHALDFGVDVRMPNSFAFESETKQAKWKLKREEKTQLKSTLRRNVFGEQVDES